LKLAALAAAWIVGLLVGLETDVYLAALVLFSLAAGILALLLRSRGVSPWAALLMVVMLMGLIRVEAPEGAHFLKSSDSLQIVTLRGLVVSDPELAGRGVEFTLSVETADGAIGRMEGGWKVLVFARPPRELVQTRKEPYFRYGDSLELIGRLEKPPALGGFDYRAYLATQGIHSTMPFPQVRLLDEGGGKPAQGFIYGLRRKVSEGLDRALPEPQASLAQALLLGLRGSLPKDVSDDFRSTGTSHLLAISGLQVGVLLFLSLGAAAWLMGRRRQVYLLLSLCAIWLYALVSGFSAPVERAAIMGSVYLLSLALGRPGGALPALALAAGVMAGIEPQVLKQVSFQLSFAAVAGIALIAQHDTLFLGRFSGLPAGDVGRFSALIRGIMLAVMVSVAATVATLPLVAFNFHTIPTLGVLATFLTLPPQALLLATSAIAAVAGLAHPLAGQVVGWAAWVPLEYTIWLVHLFAQVPGSVISVPAFSGLLLWAYYGALALMLLLPGGPCALWGLLRRLVEGGRAQLAGKGTPTSTFRFPVVEYLMMAGGLSVLAALLWYYAIAGPDGKLHVHFLDVGQGDSVLIVTPKGTQVLVDGGPGSVKAARAVGGRVPFWDRDLDMVVLTHPDEDHFRGLVEVLDRYGVDVVLEGGGVSENPMYLAWEKALEREGATRVTAFQGQTIALDSSTWLEVLNPLRYPIIGTRSDSNNNGIVLRLLYGGVSFLLTADIEAEAEERLLREGLPLQATVLKVAHHGSRTSTTPDFLSAVSPVAAVVSAGADNPYGHPHPEVTDRLQAIPGGGSTYLTSERGNIEFITDGNRLWMRTDR